MATIDVQQIVKNFGAQRAVDGVTFTVDCGEIFGLVGPNGAGKTTTIRILLDIFKPDSGKVAILGGPMDEKKKNRIGYLPEERGLYQDLPLESCLVYLATLKDVPEPEARRRVGAWLERFELASYRRKKMKELSKGMQQKAQLIATLVHDPEVVVIDEPFSALDPVNTQMVKELLLDLRRQNRTIIMCTHQMHQVEELCDRLVLINHGRCMLYGRLEDIRDQYAGNDIMLRTPDSLPAWLDRTSVESQNGNGYRIHLPRDLSPQEFLRRLMDQNVKVQGFEIARPSLDEIFIKVVQESEAGEQAG